MDWATFWAIFFTNSSGHPVSQQMNNFSVQANAFKGLE
jgi:hypothetical protein